MPVLIEEAFSCSAIQQWVAREERARLVQDTTELIKLEEFAKRINVGRTTVFQWIKEGRLLPGRHFIKIGRVVRFEWGPDLLRKLHEDSDRDGIRDGDSNKSVEKKRRPSSQVHSNRKAVIDLKY